MERIHGENDLLPQQNILLIWPQQTGIVVATISIVANIYIVTTTITVVVTSEIVTQQFWLAEALLTERFLKVTKSFSPFNWSFS